MKFIKNNVFTSIVILLFVVFIFAAAFISKSFFANSGTPVYGDRLDNIETVEITKTNINDLTEGLKKDSDVVNVEYSLTGKIVELKITVTDGCKIDKAKKIGKSSLEYFDDEQKTNYDIQVFLIKNDTSDESFPIIGYKHSSKNNFSWTKDR